MAEQRSVEYSGQREFQKHKANWIKQGWSVVTVTPLKLRAEAAPVTAGLAVPAVPTKSPPRFHVTYERP